MNAHVNLGSLWNTCPAGKVGAEPAPSTPHKSPAEEGVITAEFAVALPAVTVVLALCLGAASTGVAQLKVEESARTAARSAGDSEAQTRSAVSRFDPAQSVQISVSPDDAAVTEAGRAREVHVRVSRPAPGVIGSATGWVLWADAHARVEGGGGTQESSESEESIGSDGE